MRTTLEALTEKGLVAKANTTIGSEAGEQPEGTKFVEEMKKCDAAVTPFDVPCPKMRVAFKNHINVTVLLYTVDIGPPIILEKDELSCG